MVNEGIRVLLSKAGQYLDKAVEARETFYDGLRQARAKARHDGTSPIMAEIKFAESTTGKTAIADNKWHMAQTRTFALMGIAKGVYVLIAEQQRTNQLLEQVNDALRRR